MKFKKEFLKDLAWQSSCMKYPIKAVYSYLTRIFAWTLNLEYFLEFSGN